MKELQISIQFTKEESNHEEEICPLSTTGEKTKMTSLNLALLPIS